MLFIWPR